MYVAFFGLFLFFLPCNRFGNEGAAGAPGAAAPAPAGDAAAAAPAAGAPPTVEADDDDLYD